MTGQAYRLLAVVRPVIGGCAHPWPFPRIDLRHDRSSARG